MEYRDVMVSVAQLEIVAKMVYKVSEISIILLPEYGKLVVHSCDITIQFTVLLCLLLEIIIFKLHGLSPRANYTDRATATCR
jgi:hypothetical protein